MIFSPYSKLVLNIERFFQKWPCFLDSKHYSFSDASPHLTILNFCFGISCLPLKITIKFEISILNYWIIKIFKNYICLKDTECCDKLNEIKLKYSQLLTNKTSKHSSISSIFKLNNLILFLFYSLKIQFAFKY